MSYRNKVILLWGLPGSGKTTYANSLLAPGSNTKIVSIDTIARYHSGNDLIYSIVHEIDGYLYNNNDVVLDGLITTNEVAQKIIDKIKETNPKVNFEIVFWEKDIEACHHNDRGRRKLNSTITIENAPFEEPNIEGIPVVKKKVEKKPNYKAWIEELGFPCDKDGTFCSESWCLGGTYGDCWGHTGTVSATPQPTAFKLFDDLLCEVCPNIGFLQYKKIYNDTVSTKIYGTGDYYGGYQEHCCYICNIEKLFNLLKEMKII